MFYPRPRIHSTGILVEQTILLRSKTTWYIQPSASDPVYNIVVGYPLDAPNDDETANQAETAHKRIELGPKRRHKVPKYFKEDFPFPFVRPFQRKMGTSLGLEEKIELGDGNSLVVERLSEVCSNY